MCVRQQEHPEDSQLGTDMDQQRSWLSAGCLSVWWVFCTAKHVPPASAEPWPLLETLNRVITVGPFIGIKVAEALQPAVAWRFP